MFIKKLIFILLCSFIFAAATKGPEYRSLRVHGMGGAFVAVADGREALYYNPAGLNLINRLGNFEKNPDMGYMPRKSFEFRLLTVSASLPGNMITDVLDVCGAPKFGKIVKKALLFDFGYLGDVEWCPAFLDIVPDDISYFPDSLANNSELAHRLAQLDHLPIEVGTQISVLEFAMHNFGLAIWANALAAPYLDMRILVPSFGYEPVHIDMVAQTAFAFSPVDKWSVGIGLKAAKRYKQPKFDFDPKFDLKNLDYQAELDTLEERWDGIVDELLKFKNFSFGLDMGVLYQINRQVRVGSSLRNIFFGKLANEYVTPNLSFGAMASPMILQSNSWWARKVHFALDFVDVADGTLGDKFFAHLNLGTEIEQVVIPAVLKIRAGTGFESGWYAWNLGMGLFEDVINVRFGSYAEERGVRTAQKEQRFWTGEVSVGF